MDAVCHREWQTFQVSSCPRETCLAHLNSAPPPTWDVSALAGTLKGSQNIPRISWQFGFQDVGAEPSTFQENATVTSEAAERQLCKTLQSNRLTTQHGEVYCQPGQYILFHSSAHTHAMPGDRARGGWPFARRGERGCGRQSTVLSRH